MSWEAVPLARLGASLERHTFHDSDKYLQYPVNVKGDKYHEYHIHRL